MAIDFEDFEFPTSFVGIDFETLYSQRDSVCSVGMVKYKDNQIVDRYYTLIRPPFDCFDEDEPELTWVHGITKEDVVNERTFEEILPEMETFAEGLPLVAHNACVEKACILETAEHYSISTILDCENIIDTYPLSKRVEDSLGLEIKGRGTHTLDVTCRRFGVEEMHHHNALEDAEMCGNLLLALAETMKGQTFKSKSKPAARKVVKFKKFNPEDMIQREDLDAIKDNPFKGKKVVLTGFCSELSQEYGHELKLLGAKICSSVSNKTDYLICGPEPGPKKVEKAESIGVKIISEKEFFKLIKYDLLFMGLF